MDAGFIKWPREMWEKGLSLNSWVVLQWLISDAVFDKAGGERMGIKVSRGDTVVTLSKVAREINQSIRFPKPLTEEAVDWALKRLEQEGFIKRWTIYNQGNKQYARIENSSRTQRRTLVTICKFDSYSGNKGTQHSRNY